MNIGESDEFEFATDIMENEGIETPSLQDQLNAALIDNKVLSTAVMMLKQKLDYHKIPYFNDVYVPLTKKPSEMSREELFTRNKEAQTRIENNRHVKSSLSLPMETSEQENERLIKDSESSVGFESVILHIFEAANKNGGAVTADQLKEILSRRKT